MAAGQDAPLCWNAPGVAGSLSPVASRLARWTASITDYPSVRDETSRRLLEEAGVEREVGVVPDTALEVSRLWTEAEVSEAREEAFASRGQGVPRRSVVFHVNRRWVGEEPAEVAARVERISTRLDAFPVLIAIGPCHGDDEIQRRVAAEMETEPLLMDRPRSLLEVAACIARSEAYIGSSLHGMITALSFARPVMLVAGGEDAKYDGLLDHLGLRSWRVASWERAEERASDLLDAPQSTWNRASEAAEPALEQHWQRLRETLVRGGETGNRSAALEELSRVGEESFGGTEMFHALLAESLADRQSRLEEQVQSGKELKQRLALESQRLREQRQKSRSMASRQRELQEERQSELQEEQRRRREDVERLSRWIEALERDVSEMRRSRRWRLGESLGRLDPRTPGEAEKPEATDRMDETFEQFHVWRRERENG